MIQHMVEQGCIRKLTQNNRLITVSPKLADEWQIGRSEMGILNNKSKMDYQTFCKFYYNSQILHSIVDGEDLTQKVLDWAYNTIIEEDDSFSIVTRDKFGEETVALNLELFLLAWFRHFKKIEKSIIQSIFTYNYFSEMGRLEIWENMKEYNLMVAKSATLKPNGWAMTGETAIERAIITRVNQKRFSIAKNWCKANNINESNITKEQESQLKCVAQCANRIDVDLYKNNEVGMRYITGGLLFKLGWREVEKVKPETYSKLVGNTLSMYRTAEKMIKNTKIDI